MKKSEFILDLRHEGLGEAWANRIAVKAEEAGASWDPEVDLRPCPNPECSDPEALRVQWSNLNGWVVCDGCSVEGPAAPSEGTPRRIVEAEAIRLWNLLPRTQDEVPAGDPGERELPERLTMEVDWAGVGIIDQADRIWLDLTTIDEEIPLSLTEREKLKELLARYNAWGRYVGEQEPGTVGKVWASSFSKILQEEREKLR